MRHEEELIKIRLRVAERRAALVHDEAARTKAEATKTRKHVAREEEIQVALSQRNPPVVSLRACTVPLDAMLLVLNRNFPLRCWLPKVAPEP